MVAPGMNPTLITKVNIDIDTFILKKYVKGSNFTNYLDSVLIDTINSLYQTRQDTTDVVIGITNATMTSAYDYEMVFPAPGLILKITAIDESHMEASCPSKTACVDPINSYKINDSLVTKSNPFDNSILISIN